MIQHQSSVALPTWLEEIVFLLLIKNHFQRLQTHPRLCCSGVPSMCTDVCLLHSPHKALSLSTVNQPLTKTEREWHTHHLHINTQTRVPDLYTVWVIWQCSNSLKIPNRLKLISNLLIFLRIQKYTQTRNGCTSSIVSTLYKNYVMCTVEQRISHTSKCFSSAWKKHSSNG